jgi:hypothetical protein
MIRATHAVRPRRRSSHFLGVMEERRAWSGEREEEGPAGPEERDGGAWDWGRKGNQGTVAPGNKLMRLPRAGRWVR